MERSMEDTHCGEHAADCIVRLIVPTGITGRHVTGKGEAFPEE